MARSGGDEILGMEYFAHHWAAYRTIVEHDLMDHRAITSAVAMAIEGWLADRQRNPSGALPPTMVDLGCGDLALLPPLLRRLPLGSFTAIDMTPGVLPLAQAALGPVPYPTHWEAGDLLQWASPSAKEGPSVDILHSAFALHHLSDADKALFLESTRRRLHADGIFLWADVFRNGGESLEAYLARMTRRVRQDWGALTPSQMEQTLDHINSLDQPADRSAIVQVAESAEWRWQWLWQGQSQCEALALLRPC